MPEKSKVIWKFEIENTGDTEIFMSKDAEILTVKLVQGRVCLYALLVPTNEREIRKLTVQATGWHLNLNDIKKYIGTVLANGGQFVWHVFELK